MHDTDRTLAELAALDHAEHEADEFDLESEYADLETLDNMNDYEFEPEGDFEGGFQGESFGAAQYEGPQFEGAQYEAPQYEGPQYEGPQYEGPQFEAPQYEAEQYEGGYGDQGEAAFEAEDQFEGEGSFQPERESTFSEAAQMELAAELLELQGEDELEYFLGDLLKAAVGKIGAALTSPVGKQLVGLLKGAAGKILPAAGSIVGGMFGGPAGAMIGGNVASAAGNILGLELEGLAREDQEFETAKAFVRLAADAAQQAAVAPPTVDPLTVAQAAIDSAATRHAPGLLATSALGPALDPGHPFHHHRRRHQHRMSGRWFRVGHNQIVLHGL